MGNGMDNELNRRLLKRGVSEIIIEGEMIKYLTSGRKLRLKQGFDPSCPDIHLGHVVGLRKLRQFQELGHEVILIVGDWTAQIGDPSGRSQTRPMLTAQEVKSNADTYMKQFFKVVDRDKTTVVWQSEWFGKFDLAEVIKLTSRFTVAQMLQREDFAKRYAGNQPIAITEFLYPLLQAYDSVVVKADVEFGGTDQKFNCLVGRELQQMLGQPPQQVFLVPLLVGTDGSMKMSKSLGNYISIDEPASDMYGKVLSIPDRLIMDYFELLTDVPDDELTIFRGALENDSVNPLILKKRLARELVTEFHGKPAAQEAERHFEKVVQMGETPEEIEVHATSFEELRQRLLGEMGYARQNGEREMPVGMFASEAVDDAECVSISVPFLLYDELRLVLSRSEAKRLLAQGAVEIDGKKVTDDIVYIRDGSTVKVGKRRFKKIVDADSPTATPAAGETQEVPGETSASGSDSHTTDDSPGGQPVDIVKWLVENHMARSAEEVERLISRGDLQIINENGNHRTVVEHVVNVAPGDVVKYGKRRFAKVADFSSSIDSSAVPADEPEDGESDIATYYASFRQMEDEALLAAARESRASALTATRDSFAPGAKQSTASPQSLAVTVPFILCKTGLVTTQREAKRLLAQGSIEIDGDTITKDIVTIRDGSVITIDKNRCMRIVNADTGL